MHKAIPKGLACLPIQRIIRTLLMGAAGLCGTISVAMAQQPQQGTSSYEQHLHQGYLQLAATNRAEGDYGDMKLFENKAARAARGAAVDPDDPTSRQLPAATQHSIRAAHGRLLQALNNGAFVRHPREVASAQVMYDCWLEALEDGSQPQQAASCSSAFHGAMARIAGTRPASGTMHAAHHHMPHAPTGNRCPHPADAAMARQTACPTSSGQPRYAAPAAAYGTGHLRAPTPATRGPRRYHIVNCSGHCWDGEYILPRREQRMFPLPKPWMQ